MKTRTVLKMICTLLVIILILCLTLDEGKDMAAAFGFLMLVLGSCGIAFYLIVEKDKPSVKQK